jgi:predicted AlkP superfamily phosphohydrolase/phosphomutase
VRRVLCFGLDGGDHELVARLIREGELPTLASLSASGAFGPLRSTIPAFTPTAWSSLLTGMNPASHGIFGFSTNPNRATRRLDSAASRAGTPLWRLLGAAGIRSAFITVPFTYPAEPIDGIIVTGFGGPQYPEILPVTVANRILAAHPNLITAVAPTGWTGRADAMADALIGHVGEIADVCLLAMELEPDLGLLCVDFMASDIAGHLAWHRYDHDHPAHRADDSGDELVRVYRAIDRAVGDLIGQARWLYGDEPTVVVMSDHGLQPAYWMFNANAWLEREGFLRFDPRAIRRMKRKRASGRGAPPDEHLGPARTRRRRVIDRLRSGRPGSDSAFPIVDFEASRAYCYGYGGQIYMSEANGARHDDGLIRELGSAFASIPHPSTGAPAFDVHRKEEIYSGPFMDRAPELIVLPRDERIHVASSPRPGQSPFELLDRLDRGGNWSGHHAMKGFLLADGPGIRDVPVPDGAAFGQMASTLLALHGLDAALELPPIAEILDDSALPRRREVEAAAQTPSDEPTYSSEQEAAIVEHLRALGYE